MKSYIKSMIRQGATKQQVLAYIMEISDRLPLGILDSITKYPRVKNLGQKTGERVVSWIAKTEK